MIKINSSLNNEIDLNYLLKKLNITPAESLNKNPGIAFDNFLKKNNITQKEVSEKTGKYKQVISKSISSLKKEIGLLKTLYYLCNYTNSSLSFIIICENEIYTGNNLCVLIEKVRAELNIRPYFITSSLNKSSSFYSNFIDNLNSLGVRFKTLNEVLSLLNIDLYYLVSTDEHIR